MNIRYIDQIIVLGRWVIRYMSHIGHNCTDFNVLMILEHITFVYDVSMEHSLCIHFFITWSKCIDSRQKYWRQLKTQTIFCSIASFSNTRIADLSLNVDYGCKTKAPQIITMCSQCIVPIYVCLTAQPTHWTGPSQTVWMFVVVNIVKQQ